MAPLAGKRRVPSLLKSLKPREVDLVKVRSFVYRSFFLSRLVPAEFLSGRDGRDARPTLLLFPLSPFVLWVFALKLVPYLRVYFFPECGKILCGLNRAVARSEDLKKDWDAGVANGHGPVDAIQILDSCREHRRLVFRILEFGVATIR